ncbi:MAG: hypothetical protein GEU92_05555 [Alphaproteobacteria bacterium]|nr:hypothetical protein [Alphaproteobacteria bacterium]
MDNEGFLSRRPPHLDRFLPRWQPRLASTAACLSVACFLFQGAGTAHAYPQVMPDALWQPFSTLESVAAGNSDPDIYEILVAVAPGAATGSRTTPLPLPQSTNVQAESASRLAGLPEAERGRPAGAPSPATAGERPQPAAGGRAVVAPEGADATDPNASTLRDFVRYAFTTIGNPGAIGQGPDRQTGGTSVAAGLIESILDAAISAEMINVISEVVSPALSPDGFIAMTVAEMGQFIIMFVREAGGIRLIDLNDKSRLSLEGDGFQRPRSTLQRGGEVRTGAGGNKLTLGDFLDLIHDFVDTYILNPLTLGVTLFAVLIWVVSRLRSTEA